MKFLLDIPLVISLATWIWGEDPAEDVTPEVCVETFPWMIAGCWSRLLVKGVGIAIIFASCLNKTPIILNILDSKSAAGLSRTAVYGESIVYANCALYGLLQSQPISAYGENIAMTIQSIVIMILIWKFTNDPPVSLQERFLAVTICLAYVGGITLLLPAQLYYLLMASIWPLQILSRGSQIRKTFHVKHTGAQSVITTSMNLFGCAVRILTTIKEVGWDMAVLVSYFLGIILNSIIFVQYWIYRENTDSFLRQLKEKKVA